METAHEIVVRPTEVDVNGHVNNAKYVEYNGVGARGVTRAPGACLRPVFGARGRDGESEVKGGRKSMLDDPLPARTASRQTSGRTGSAGHRPSTLSTFGNQAVVSSGFDLALGAPSTGAWKIFMVGRRKAPLHSSLSLRRMGASQRRPRARR